MTAVPTHATPAIDLGRRRPTAPDGRATRLAAFVAVIALGSAAIAAAAVYAVGLVLAPVLLVAKALLGA